MCRLYGFRGTAAAKVECSLVRGQNALLRQSAGNADGWGIAYYRDGAPIVERRAAAAFRDLQFSDTAQRVFARTVVAHVRWASVGAATPENTHPFSRGPWVLAHNGGVEAFDRVGPRLESEIAADLMRARRGTTDSELVFLWLLSRLAREGIDPGSRCGDVKGLVRVVATAIPTLGRWCQEEGAVEPAVLNLILTDGEQLVATRWNIPLFWLAREGVEDCELCGTSHVRLSAGNGYRSVVIASEPICQGAWHEAQEGSLLRIDHEARVMIVTL